MLEMMCTVEKDKAEMGVQSFITQGGQGCLSEELAFKQSLEGGEGVLWMSAGRTF